MSSAHANKVSPRKHFPRFALGVLPLLTVVGVVATLAQEAAPEISQAPLAGEVINQITEAADALGVGCWDPALLRWDLRPQRIG